jgi:SMODS and SLOG-associating 2TM effector domain 1
VLGVAAGVGGADTLSAWVPVVTTVAASLTAHIAASRYDHQIVEFLRAAQQLELLDVKRRRQELTNAEFIDACESGSSQLMGQAG